MRQYIDSVGLGSGGTACRFVASHFKDNALSWWRDYSKDGTRGFDTFDLDELLESLKEYFSDVDEEQRWMQQLLRIRQIDSVAAFAMRLKHIQLKLGSKRVPDSVALHLFTNGLKPFTKQQVALHRPDTLEDAILIAERAESSLFTWRGKSHGGHKSNGG